MHNKSCSPDCRCDGCGTPEGTLDVFEDMHIGAYGWSVVVVQNSPTNFMGYTVGLTAKGLPEVYIQHQPTAEEAHAKLNAVARNAASGYLKMKNHLVLVDDDATPVAALHALRDVSPLRRAVRRYGRGKVSCFEVLPPESLVEESGPTGKFGTFGNGG